MTLDAAPVRLAHLGADLEATLRGRQYRPTLEGLQAPYITVSRDEMDALVQAVTSLDGPAHLRLDEQGRLCWRHVPLLVGALPPTVTRRMAERRAA